MPDALNRSFLIVPPKLRAGDKVRFVSPASTPERAAVMQAAAELETWGLKVDFGEHAFRQTGYLAGTDAERLSDLNGAIRDPSVRAVFATRGGKGSYRIADQLDFTAARNDAKVLGWLQRYHRAAPQLKCGTADWLGIHGAVERDSRSLRSRR